MIKSKKKRSQAYFSVVWKLTFDIKRKLERYIRLDWIQISKQNQDFDFKTRFGSDRISIQK